MSGSIARSLTHGLASSLPKGLASIAPTQIPPGLKQAFAVAPRASSSTMFNGLAFSTKAWKDSKAAGGEPVKDHSVIVTREPKSYRPSAVSLLKGIVGDMPAYVPGMADLEKVSEAAFTPIEDMEPFSQEQVDGDRARARVRELQDLQKTMEPEAFGALLRKESRALFETLAGTLPDSKKEASFVYSKRIDGSQNTLPVAWEAPGPVLKLKGGGEMNSRKAAGFDAGAVATFLQAQSEETLHARFPVAGLDSGPAVQSLGHELVAQSGAGRRELILAETPEREVTGFADLAPVSADALGEHFTAHGQAGVVRRDASTCEVSVLVGDSNQGKGLGRALLAQALQTAKDQGFEQVSAVVSQGNTGMLKLLAEAGITTRVPARTEGYLHFMADLSKLKP